MGIVNRVYNQATLLFNRQKRILKWSRTKTTAKNIGDALNPFIFEKLYNKKPVNLSDTFNYGIFPVYALIGSILDNNKVQNLIVMGAGFKSETSKMPSKPSKVISVRGPLSRKRFIDMGIDCPEVYGDPAILLPKFYNPVISTTHKMGVIPHYVDKDNSAIAGLTKLDDVKEIDVFLDFKNFVKELKSCEFTLSSSLHGVIISHSYGIPSVWVKFSDKVLGGNFKFEDYYSSMNMKVLPYIWDENYNLTEIEERKSLPNMEHMIETQKKLFQWLSSQKL